MERRAVQHVDWGLPRQGSGNGLLEKHAGELRG